MGVLDLLFPKRCVGCKKSGEYICSNCFASISFDVESICTVCNKPSLDGRTHPVCQKAYTLDGTFSAVAYKGIIRKLLYQLKYQPYLTDLIPDLVDLCYESLIQKEVFARILTEKPLLVPIPLSAERLRKRGYNQAELLAKELGKRFNLDVQLLLKRVKETKPQYGLKREERQENMKEAFAMNEKLKMKNEKTIYSSSKEQSNESRNLKDNSSRQVYSEQSRTARTIRVAILIDDVLTTGSTMQEAAKVLKKHGFEHVWGIALAKD